MATIREVFAKLIPPFETYLNRFGAHLPESIFYRGDMSLKDGFELRYYFTHDSDGLPELYIVNYHRMAGIDGVDCFKLDKEGNKETLIYLPYKPTDREKYAAWNRSRGFWTNEDFNHLLDLKNYLEFEAFDFFWETKHPFSQWHKKRFVAQGNTFTSAEQYMMYNKAILFDDYEIGSQILLTTNPRMQKALGRQVKNFDPERWALNCRRIVYEGNYHKFNQNQDIKDQLKRTAGKFIVESAPDDSIWGIGLSKEDERAKDANKWLGSNWLGCILTQLREDFFRID